MKRRLAGWATWGLCLFLCMPLGHGQGDSKAAKGTAKADDGLKIAYEERGKGTRLSSFSTAGAAITRGGTGKRTPSLTTTGLSPLTWPGMANRAKTGRTGLFSGLPRTLRR